LVCWQLSRLTLRLPQFPLGTFVSNLLATALLGSFSLSSSAAIHPSSLSCQALIGLSDGFCGCLSTVSTFIAEILSLRKKFSYIYGITTVVAGQITLVLIIGVYYWSENFSFGDAKVVGCFS